MNTHWLYMLDCPAPILNIINKGLIKWEVGGNPTAQSLYPICCLRGEWETEERETGTQKDRRQGNGRQGDEGQGDRETRDREIGRETSKETRYRETERREKGR